MSESVIEYKNTSEGGRDNKQDECPVPKENVVVQMKRLLWEEARRETIS